MLKRPFMCRAASADFYASRSAGWVLLCLGVALWMLCNPYAGIWHDARFYAVMALRRLDPAAYANDPWFMFGSQDRFSIFSNLYAPAIASFGLERAAMLYALLGGLAFVVAVKRFAQSHLEGRSAALLMLLLIGLPLAYCPNDWTVFYVAESFATARPFAFAASLQAISVQRVSGWKHALVWHGLAFSLHPLIAIGAIALTYCTTCSYRQIGGMTLFALGGACVLAVLGWGPMQPMGTPWLNLVEQTGMVVVQSGPHHDASPVVLIFALLVCGVSFGHISLRSWYGSALFLGAMGYFTSLLVSYFYPAHLLLEVQTWRTLWLSVIYAIVASVDLGLTGFVRATRRSATLVGIALVLHYSIFGGWGLLVYALFLRWGWPGIAKRFESGHLKQTFAATRLIAMVLIFLALPSIWVDLYSIGLALPLDRSPTKIAALDGMFTTGGYAALAFFLWLIFIRFSCWISIAAATIVMCLIAGYWDHRLPKHRQGESAYGPVSPSRLFGDFVKTGEVVYWHHNVERVWFELGTSSYAGRTQAVGIVFNEKFALELERRLGLAVSAMADVDDGKLDQVFHNKAPSQRWNLLAYETTGEAGSLTLSPSGLRRLCRDHALDWVIDQQHFPELASAVKHEATDDGVQSISLYECRRIRRKT